MNLILLACLMEFQKVDINVRTHYETKWLEKYDKPRSFKDLWIEQCIARKQVGYDFAR